jgi:hypothetical protein
MVLLMNIPVGSGSAKWLYRDILPIIGHSEIRKSPLGGGRQMGRHRFLLKGLWDHAKTETGSAADDAATRLSQPETNADPIGASLNRS